MCLDQKLSEPTGGLWSKRALGLKSGFAVYLLAVWPWSGPLPFQFLLKLWMEIMILLLLLLPLLLFLLLLQLLLEIYHHHQHHYCCCYYRHRAPVARRHKRLGSRDMYRFQNVPLKGEGMFLLHLFSTLLPGRSCGWKPAWPIETRVSR